MSSETEPHPNHPPRFPETEAEIRGAVLEFYRSSNPKSKKSCFDPRPIKYMTFSALNPMPAYRYTLETFVETRAISSKTTPFRDLFQNVPPSQPCPDPWSINVPPPDKPPGKAIVEFKETAAVVNCPNCPDTPGRSKCAKCRGGGTYVCMECGGKGWNFFQEFRGHASPFVDRGSQCYSCVGRGFIQCRDCNMTGWHVCRVCEGGLKVILWNILEVTWSTKVNTFRTTQCDLSSPLLDACSCWSGKEQVSLPSDPKPLEFPQDPEITKAALQFVNEMMAKQDGCKVIAFKQTLVQVPIVKVDFRWKGHQGTFYVYGADKRVHFPDKYPGSSCGGCCCCGNSPCAIV